MTHTLEAKLAAMVQYQQQVRYNGRVEDQVGFDSYLNDPEVLDWVDRMDKNGFIGTTRFVRRDGR